ncbi:MAG: hypothetical protein WBK77_10265, partial [Alphaproteobacteria bacterium]
MRKVFLLITFFFLVLATSAQADWFLDSWPSVRERIEALATETSLSGRMTLDCTPSDQWIVPSIDLADGVKLQLSFPMEKYLKECYPSEQPQYSVFHRDGEMIVYYLYKQPGNENKNNVVLKEWIYTEKPNTANGSHYAWELKTAEGGDHGLRVESTTDGGLTVYDKDQSWRID